MTRLALISALALLANSCQSLPSVLGAIPDSGLCGLFNDRREAADALQDLLVRHTELLRTIPGIAGSDRFDGVSQLEPDHPYFEALAAREIEVPHHSIIGVAQPGQPLEETSDLIVPCTSAHLDTALSEQYVEHWHLFTNEEASVELVFALLREYAEDLPDSE